MFNKFSFIPGFDYTLVSEIDIKIDIYPKELIKDRYINLCEDGFLLLESGYAWDSFFFGLFDNEKTIPSFAILDALYRLIRYNYLDISMKEQIDRLFYQLLLSKNVNTKIANILYFLVTKYGMERINKSRDIITIKDIKHVKVL
jgi:hypothetical protein